MFTATTIDLIRHGEPVGGQKLRGAQDDPLSELGWQQMHKSVKHHQDWDIIVTSPLSRCQAFAETLAQKHGLDLHINASFREISFGEWEGLAVKTLMETEPDKLRNYWQNPDLHTPQGGERMHDFVTRVHTAWDALVKEMHQKHCLLVCHGGVIRAILTRILGMPNDKLWNIDVPYANVSRISYHHFPDGGETAQLRFHQAGFPKR